MTYRGAPAVGLSQFPLGEPQPLLYDYQGVRYAGEVVRDESWSPQWGESLTGDIYFRIVLLEQSAPPQFGRHDSRIAVCLPGAMEYRQRDQMLNELATVREAQSLYLTQRDPEADLILRTLQSRQENLEQELVARDVARYSSGSIVVAAEQPLNPADLFSGSEPVIWFSRIAHWLLERAYPSLPINTDLLPRPITHEDASRIFRAVFDQPGASPAVLAELGPALGLPIAGSGPGDAGLASPVMDAIAGQLSAQPGPTPWPEVHHHLAHDLGLTRPLATLYLLLFLCHHSPHLELRLSPEHELALTTGQPFSGSRLTADLVPVLAWDDRLAEWGSTIGPAGQPTWNDALPYLAALCPELVPASEGAAIAGQEQRLRQGVTALARDVARGKEFLNMLDQRAGTSLEASQPVSLALDRLSGVASNDFQSVYQSVRHIYADYLSLQQDVEQLRRLSELAQSSEQVRAAWEYLDNAVVPLEMSNLSIDKRGLEAVLAPDSLLRPSRGWSAVAQQIADFKARYTHAYRAHHEQVNQSLPGYQHRLNSAGLKLRALELLNTIPELGPPAGEQLTGDMGFLEPQCAACTVPPEELDLQQEPWCHTCGLTLEQSLPEGALDRQLNAIDIALGEKNRTLSNLLVERILHGEMDQQLEDFLKIVQASDLSALSNTITEELVAFIRRMLG